MDIFDQVSEKKDIFDSIPIKKDIFDTNLIPKKKEPSKIWEFLKSLGPQQVVLTDEEKRVLSETQGIPMSAFEVGKEPKTFGEEIARQTDPHEALKWALGTLPVQGPKILEKIGIIRGAKEAERLRPVTKPFATVPLQAGEKAVTAPIQAITKILPSEVSTTAVKPGVTVEGVSPSISEIEASVKGGATAPLPKYAGRDIVTGEGGSSINLQKWNTSEDIKHFQNDLAKSIEEKIGRKSVSWDEAKRQAEGLGWDIKEMEKQWKKKGSFSQAEIDAARQINVNTISDLQEMVRTLPDRSQYTPEMRAQVMDALTTTRVTSQAATESGRSLNIHKRILSRDPEFKQISEINRVLKIMEGAGVKRTDDILDALKNIINDNPAEVNRFVYDVTHTKWEKISDSVYELWLNGLLSNPMTHIVNTTSNALTLAGSMPERALASGIESIRAKVTGTAKESYLGESKQEIFSLVKGIHAGTKRFFDAMKTGVTGTSKLETKISALPPSVQKFMPTRALMAEDELFKGFIENTELSRLAYRSAKKEGLKGQPFQERINELLKNPTEEMLEQSAVKAKYLTFQKDLGKVGNLVIKARDMIPGAKYFIPFVRTPINIAKYSLERTPLNIPRIAYKSAKGELSGLALSEEIAKMTSGGILGLGTYLLAEEGYITGGGPKNSLERAEKQRTGWEPYAVKIGGKYYSFARLEPLASIMGIAADFNELKDKMTEDEKIKVGGAIAGSISKNITSKTFTQGYSRLNNAIFDPERYAEEAIEGLAGSVIPSGIAGISRTVDPYFREARGIIDTVRSRIPLVSKEVPAKINVWGEPIKRPGTPITRFLSPVQVSEEKGDPIDKELVRLKLNLGMPSKKIGETELNPNQYRQMIAEEGQKTKKELNSLIGTYYYKHLNDQDKEDEIKKISNKNKKIARERMRIRLKISYGESQ